MLFSVTHSVFWLQHAKKKLKEQKKKRNQRISECREREKRDFL